MNENDSTFEQSIRIVREATRRGVPLKLLGGQAIRLLCPEFPHRARLDQDIDLASVSEARPSVMDLLTEQGFLSDGRFNALHGHAQLYFTSADGRTGVDVIIDKLAMCHVLEFGTRIDNMPDTLDVTDLLLSKLQIVELNRKDMHDTVHLLSGFSIRPEDEPTAIALRRIGALVGEDWGWWRTTTANLEKIRNGARGEDADLVPSGRQFDPAEQAQELLDFCMNCPKSLRWRLRARLGDRIQWYELPEEVDRRSSGAHPS